MSLVKNEQSSMHLNLTLRIALIIKLSLSRCSMTFAWSPDSRSVAGDWAAAAQWAVVLSL